MNDSTHVEQIADILATLRHKGIQLWSEDGALRFKAPKGALQAEELERLRAAREQIVRYLDTENDRPIDRAPLSFTQQAHWQLFRLGEQPSWRNVASVLRLRGRLRIAALESSIAEVVRRHDALRTSVVVRNGIPVQEVAPAFSYELELEDLTNVSDSHHAQHVQSSIEQHVFAPLDVTTEPLFMTRLLRLRADEHILMVATEHLVSDGFSRDILVGEIFAAYSQAGDRKPVTLLPVATQLSRYAFRQRSMEAQWLQNHGDYWKKRLQSCERLHFPSDPHAASVAKEGLGVVRFEIGQALKEQLRAWSRKRRTTLVMAALTAYVALILCWCKTSDAVILCQTDGRFGPELQNTIGYLAFRLYLRIELGSNDRLTDLLEKVMAEYCNAHEHADFGYLEAQMPRPGFSRNSWFNWITQGQNDGVGLDTRQQGIECSPVSISRTVIPGVELDTEPMVGFLETPREVRGSVVFPQSRLTAAGMERFARNLLLIMTVLATEPETPVARLQLE